MNILYKNDEIKDDRNSRDKNDCLLIGNAYCQTQFGNDFAPKLLHNQKVYAKDTGLLKEHSEIQMSNFAQTKI